MYDSVTDSSPALAEGIRFKLTCSSIREPDRFDLSAANVVSENPAPRDGDLVVVRCVTNEGAYDHVEDRTGRPVRLYAGDVFVATLGTRRSGTNLTGEVPDRPLRRGERLDLVAQGGLIAKATFIPGYYGRRALPLEVIGFFRTPSGGVANTGDTPPIDVASYTRSPTGRNVLFVLGTSAEAGKTTFVCHFNIAAKQLFPALRTAAIKACGTGRAKDCISYRDANYDVVVDFADAGLPSTYNVDPIRFRRVLDGLIVYCEDRADIIVVEIGGDFLEARAPEAIAAMGELAAPCVLLVNDAMGALESMRRLREIGLAPIAIGCYRQNLAALASRLDLSPERIFEPMDLPTVRNVVARLGKAWKLPSTRAPVPT